jgi:hypothetical protein
MPSRSRPIVSSPCRYFVNGLVGTRMSVRARIDDMGFVERTPHPVPWASAILRQDMQQ